MAAFGQGYASMSSPAKEFEKMVLARKLVHGDNPVLRWNASNVAIQRDAAENIKPVKDKSTGRIDGIVAAVMAVGRAASAGGSTRSYYETNPLEIG
jgi:phage terminase large subunit-like protein